MYVFVFFERVCGGAAQCSGCVCVCEYYATQHQQVRIKGVDWEFLLKMFWWWCWWCGGGGL